MKNHSVSRERLDTISAEKGRIVDKLLFAWAVTLVPFGFLVVYFGNQYGWGFQSLLEIGLIVFMWLIIFSRKLLSAENIQKS